MAPGFWLLVPIPDAKSPVGAEDGSFPDVDKQFWDSDVLFNVTLLLKDPSTSRWLLIGTAGLAASNCSYELGIAQVGRNLLG